MRVWEKLVADRKHLPRHASGQRDGTVILSIRHPSPYPATISLMDAPTEPVVVLAEAR
jgi:hypothetical protein